ncbi:CCCH zinc finger and SMR domain-containing protein [Pseudovirgaria hyperparasitica]|uniref:CCCH zinc finger and SMR domain-containing protein n=1 Tax=Pseudovirgaria hyperparasitica TaxID=470096 RepID=A0A6A6W1I1_9PEZI|nr:CCCH zinc finger and SMR domain-containing protein [Pseudovirgaria hyperparasitica]KAF2756778.1 CCCH zinc finger and SMR domain-containing protein [Pseudovirgaria hyperparasitica]
MIPDAAYDLCLPILQDDSLDDDDKTEKVEELLRKETSLTGKSLEGAVLDALWRYRDSTVGNSTSPPPSRHTVVRRPSPAAWQLARASTPLGSSPRIAPPPGFGIAPPGFARAKSSTASPFTSPRPSPRLAFSSPHIPHSPSLSAYQFSESSYTPDPYGDLNSDSVDWLVNDDAVSEASSLQGETGLNGAAAEWVQPYTMDMEPYDMLRSVLRDDKSNEELEKALQENEYDLSATILALMGEQGLTQPSLAEAEKTFTVGKSMSPAFRPATPAGQAKSNILCKYWLSSGHCARADCRFSHDPSKTLCKYFIQGNCLAGETCMFSHDPSALMARLMLEGGAGTQANTAPNFHVQDYEAFPALQQTPSNSYLDPSTVEAIYNSGGSVATPPPGLNPFANFVPSSQSRSQSRPGSRQQSRAVTPSAPSVNDDEAFPTLGSAATRGGKRHHGKRGAHGASKENVVPQSMADLVKMSPSPSPAQLRKGVRSAKSFQNSRENSAAAQAIPAPERVPWLDTGDSANKAYLKARQEAFKHGGLRNKFLQSAAQAWNRNDSRAAKALSLRGQSENDLMRKAHREAAQHLYEERNKDLGPNARELYVDLHGLHPEEAVTYLENILLKHQATSRPIYAITGTGHHSKNGKDKVGKAIRGFLNEWRYVFREFSVPGDRNNVGGILGVDPSSWDRSLGERTAKEFVEEGADDGKRGELGTKIQLLKRGEDAGGAKVMVGEIPKGPRARLGAVS